METKERKIMVEVTEEEYERIKAGALEEHIPTYEEIKQDLLKNLSDQDAKLLLEKHSSVIFSNALDEALISEIIHRTKNRSQIERGSMRDAASARDFMFSKGTLNHIMKKDCAKIGDPVFESLDEFSWVLKVSEKIYD